MKCIIFIGIQASGKSTFFKDYFFYSYVRISKDLLKTRNKENLFIDLCINTGQKFVIDNTNATKELRKDYISKIKTRKYKIIGYYFESKINDCINRNNLRDGKEKIPEKGILGIYNKLELPSLDEGFDELYYVSIINSKFHIKEWNNEI